FWIASLWGVLEVLAHAINKRNSRVRVPTNCGHHFSACTLQLALGLWIYSLSGKTRLLVRQAAGERIGRRLSARTVRNRTVHSLQVSPQPAKVFRRVPMARASAPERN